MNQTLRWGVLSTARIGVNAVIPAIQQSRNGIVTAIASRDAKTAQDAARAANIPHAFGSYEQLLESDMVDAIYNPLPNHLHREWTIRAAEHGKHILCEKPFALNTAQVDAMIAAAKQHRVQLMEAFMYRFHPQVARAKELLAQGVIGKIKTIRSAFCFTLNRSEDIRLKKETGGGSLMDVGCYCVNMTRLFAGAEPTQVQASQVTHAGGVDDSFSALLQFPDNVVGVFDCSFRTDYVEWVQVQGTEGRLDVSRPVKPLLNPGEIILRQGEKSDHLATVNTITTPAANHYQLMCEHFADAVLTGAPLAYPPELDRGNMRVIDALYEAARTGRAVQL
ncbi:MAG: Gfo/Idh/MocA family oxidoreductase [Chloroflexi bacterium]|nr:Gfo/Idh/MocA family oxidoreductase [Chloroflexota bacterium]